MTIHTESNEWPSDVLSRGTHDATWHEFYLRLTKCDTRVPTMVRFPGNVACTVTVTDDTITVTVELAS